MMHVLSPPDAAWLCVHACPQLGADHAKASSKYLRSCFPLRAGNHLNMADVVWHQVQHLQPRKTGHLSAVIFGTHVPRSPCDHSPVEPTQPSLISAVIFGTHVPRSGTFAL